jgi:hypothetical protein
MNCKKKITPSQTLFEIFDTLNIENHKKAVLQERYLQVLNNFNNRSSRLSFAFYSARVIVTVGSILVPAFLSSEQTSANTSLYWATWIISLAVFISNGFITLFKLDKKYYFINTTLEMLHSEGWQYIGLTGRYAPKDSIITPTHDNQFSVFFKMAEKIKMRQVEEEYWKFTDTSGVGNATNHHPLLISESPATKQGDLASLSNEKKIIIDNWLNDMKKNKTTGLQPRLESIFDRSERRLSTPNLDESENSPRVWKSTSKTNVSMRSPLPEISSRWASSLQLSPDNEISTDTIVQVMPNEPDFGERTEIK